MSRHIIAVLGIFLVMGGVCINAQEGWQVVHQFGMGLSALSIDCASPYKVWLCGLNEATNTNQIHFSSDGGENFTLQYSGMDLSVFLVDMDMATDQVGFVAGAKVVGFPSEGAGGRTTDGGATWLPIQFSHTITVFQSVYALDAQHVWMVGTWGLLVNKSGVKRSTDGGISWHGYPVDSSYPPPRYVYFINANEGWMTCGMWPEDPTPVPCGTAEGERKTKEEGIGSIYSLYKRYENDPEPLRLPAEAYIPGYKSEQYEAVILHTTDGGQSWEQQYEDYGRFYLNDLYFKNSQNGWVSAEADLTSLLLHTTDGGQTWQEVYYPSSNQHGLSDVLFVGPNEGWAFGFGAGGFDVQCAILHTLDGGASWFRDPISVAAACMYGAFVDRHRGFTTGGNNMKRSRVLRFDDGFYGDNTPVPSSTPTRTPTDTPTGAHTQTPTRTPTPSPTQSQSTPTYPSNTFTPGPGTLTPTPVYPDEDGNYLNLNQTMFHPKDLFLLQKRAVNTHSVPKAVYDYVILDVYGMLFYWPEWSLTPDSEYKILQPQSLEDLILLEFNWPENAGAGNGLKFYAGLVDADEMGLFGAYTSVTFSYVPWR